MFRDLSEAQGSKCLVVLDQFDPCFHFQDVTANSSRQVLCCFHESAANALFLPARRDGKLPNVDGLWLAPGKEATDDLITFEREE
jgi:hypothetical protein